MKRDELEKVLASMTLEEKIGQMMQIVPWDGDGDKEVTGPMELLGLSEEQMFCCGSFLGTADPEEIERIRKASGAWRRRRDRSPGFTISFRAPIRRGR